MQYYPLQQANFCISLHDGDDDNNTNNVHMY